MSKASPKLITQEARCSLLVDYYLLPLDFRDFRYALVKNGYEISPLRNLPPPPTQISYSGEIARFKETVVFANSESGEIGVTAKSVIDAYSSLGDLLKIIASEIGVDLTQKAKYYEVILHSRIETGKDPIKEISKTENKEYIDKFSKVVGDPLSSLSLRVGKKNCDRNKGDWLDIAIEPDPVYENKYHVGVFFTNPARDKTETFVKSLESNLISLVQLIEA